MGRNICSIILLFVFLNIELNLSLNNTNNGNVIQKINQTKVKPICLIEGDIVCPKNYNENDSEYYMASIDKNKLWMNRLIPYFIDSSYSESETNLIKEAVSDLEGKTCVTFKLLSTQPENEDSVWIRPLQGCYSSIGRATGRQDLSLTPDCLNKGKGTVIHELIHALGIYHEHTRPDRGTYITIDIGNIIPDFVSNFKMRAKELVDLLGDYDYYSIMHYGIYDFSIDPKTRPTVHVLDKTIDVKKVGQRTGVSELDAKKLHKLYKCDVKECPQPVSPSGGSFNGNDYKVGAIIKYQCNTDLTLIGSNDKYCRYDGLWSGRDVQCLDEPLHYCNFESNEFCGWSPTTDSKFDWQRRSGATPQTDTGPIDDYTYETSRGHYIFMETSAPRRRGDVAKIKSKELTSSSGVVCVSFAYYMFGQKLGTLGLYLIESSLDPKLVWEQTGNQGPEWVLTKLVFKPKSNEAFNLLFEGIVGLKGSSDIALDELLIIECTEDEAHKKGFKSVKT